MVSLRYVSELVLILLAESCHHSFLRKTKFNMFGYAASKGWVRMHRCQAELAPWRCGDYTHWSQIRGSQNTCGSWKSQWPYPGRKNRRSRKRPSLRSGILWPTNPLANIALGSGCRNHFDDVFWWCVLLPNLLSWQAVAETSFQVVDVFIKCSLGWILNAFQFHNEHCLSYFAGKELHIKTYKCYMHIVIVVIIVFVSAIVMFVITVIIVLVIIYY